MSSSAVPHHLVMATTGNRFFELLVPMVMDLARREAGNTAGLRLGVSPPLSFLAVDGGFVAPGVLTALATVAETGLLEAMDVSHASWTLAGDSFTWQGQLVDGTPREVESAPAPSLDLLQTLFDESQQEPLSRDTWLSLAGAHKGVANSTSRLLGVVMLDRELLDATGWPEGRLPPTLALMADWALVVMETLSPGVLQERWEGLDDAQRTSVTNSLALGAQDSLARFTQTPRARRPGV